MEGTASEEWKPKTVICFHVHNKNIGLGRKVKIRQLHGRACGDSMRKDRILRREEGQKGKSGPGLTLEGTEWRGTRMWPDGVEDSGRTDRQGRTAKEMKDW